MNHCRRPTVLPLSWFSTKGSNMRALIFCMVIAMAGVVQGAEPPAEVVAKKVYVSHGETYLVLYSKDIKGDCFLRSLGCTDNIISDGFVGIGNGLEDIADGAVDIADGAVDTVKGVGEIGIGIVVGAGRLIYNVGDKTVNSLERSHNKVRKTLHKAFCCEKCKKCNHAK